MTQPNADILRQAYDAFGRGDIGALSSIFSEDISFSIPGNSQIAGEYKGQEAVFGLIGRIVELSGGTYRLEPHAITADDDHVVGLVAATGERHGKRMSWNAVHVFHTDGKRLTEFWEFPDQADFDEFWA